ncbi:MAG: DUF929 domain-containing protein [Thermoplasmata archaeon]|nr:DUF929 domain-containing protein [Thermoplasmata archaeon]
MVDWKAVERLRARGWDWERIAADPTVEFHPPDDPAPGATLRARYYRRASVPAVDSPSGRLPDAPAPRAPRRWGLVRGGFLLAPWFGVWAVLAWVAPSPVGVYLAAIPLLGILAAVALGVLCFGLWRSAEKWNAVYRRTLSIGLVFGLLSAGVLGGVAYAEGCRYLTPLTIGQPGGWTKAANPPWENGGSPMFFFYGSVACPYCSASSWAMEAALVKFGVLGGTSFGHSSPTDVFPNTPEVVLAGASISSAYVALDIREGIDANQVTVPPTAQCVEQGYLSAYDPVGSIPFVTVGGVYFHTSTLVDPGTLGGVSPTSLQQQVVNESGPQWSDIAPQAFFLMAFLVKLNGGQPAAVAQIPGVAADLRLIG